MASRGAGRVRRQSHGLVAPVSTTLARRLQKLEAVQRAKASACWKAGIACLHETMAEADYDALLSWMDRQCGGRSIPFLPGELLADLVLRLNPPALVRAAWILMI